MAWGVNVDARSSSTRHIVLRTVVVGPQKAVVPSLQGRNCIQFSLKDWPWLGPATFESRCTWGCLWEFDIYSGGRDSISILILPSRLGVSESRRRALRPCRVPRAPGASNKLGKQHRFCPAPLFSFQQIVLKAPKPHFSKTGMKHYIV